MRRGEVWWANIPEPWGRRPVLLLSRNDAYGILTRILAAPITTRIRRAPTFVSLTPDEDGVPVPSVISLDNLQAIPVEWLETLIVLLRQEKMLAVDRAIHFALGLRE